MLQAFRLFHVKHGKIRLEPICMEIQTIKFEGSAICQATDEQFKTE